MVPKSSDEIKALLERKWLFFNVFIIGIIKMNKPLIILFLFTPVSVR